MPWLPWVKHILSRQLDDHGISPPIQPSAYLSRDGSVQTTDLYGVIAAQRARPSNLPCHCHAIEALDRDSSIDRQPEKLRVLESVRRAGHERGADIAVEEVVIDFGPAPAVVHQVRGSDPSSKPRKQRWHFALRMFITQEGVLRTARWH